MVGDAAPRVSVVLGTHNGERWLRPCIESLAAQTLRPLEIIVIDDGSSDGSLSTLRDLDGQFPGLLAVHEQDNQGVSSVMNRAISMCSGDYVAVADHDDIYPPHRLEASLALMSETGADMVGGQTIGGMGRWLRLHKSRFPTDPVLMADRIHKGLDPLAHTTMTVRRDGFDRFGGYRPLTRAADLELMLRWAHRGARIAVSPQVLAWYRLRREHFSIDVQTGWMLDTLLRRRVRGRQARGRARSGEPARAPQPGSGAARGSSPGESPGRPTGSGNRHPRTSRVVRHRERGWERQQVIRPSWTYLWRPVDGLRWRT